MVKIIGKIAHNVAWCVRTIADDDVKIGAGIQNVLLGGFFSCIADNNLNASVVVMQSLAFFVVVAADDVGGLREIFWPYF